MRGLAVDGTSLAAATAADEWTAANDASIGARE